MRTIPRLHIVTDDAVLAVAAFPDIAEAILEVCGDQTALHLRGPATTGRRLHDIGARLAEASLRTGAWLIVNDRVDIALAVRADGVQLGARSIPIPDARALLPAGARIGGSVHATDEALHAGSDGADFVVLGTIFESASHAGRAGAGTGLIRDTVTRAAVPVVAIGGITPARVGAMAGAGAYGVAVLGGVWRAADPVTAAEEYADSVHAAWQRDNRMR